jgi:DNA-binding HxlR family transcriptional regulator
MGYAECMYRKRFDEMNCAAAQALEQIGDWWTLLLVREAFYGTTTFSGFLERLGIARNVLTERLRRLIDLEIIHREQPKPGIERYTYHLTEKGRDLLPVLVALVQWGDKWVFKEVGEPVRVVDSAQHRPIRKLAVTAADGRPLSIEDLRFRPGPGADKQTLERFAEARRRRLARKN